MTNLANIVIDSRRCTACRACELACHFHHTGTFGTSERSIRIQYDADRSEVTITFDDTCDGCMTEIEPMCVHFCVPEAIALY
jgi:Fe-S-cluster-containing dehydrogenase component